MTRDSPIMSESPNGPSIPRDIRREGLKKESNLKGDIIINRSDLDFEVIGKVEEEGGIPVRFEFGEEKIRNVTEEMMSHHIEKERSQFQTEVADVRREMDVFSDKHDNLRMKVTEVDSRIGELDSKFERIETELHRVNEDIDRLSEFEKDSRQYYAERLKSRQRYKRVEAAALSLVGLAVLAIMGAIWNIAPALYSGLIGTTIFILLGLVGIGLVGAGLYDIQRFDS